jgi:uncharacterized protein involved in outer membrane biogenesis
VKKIFKISLQILAILAALMLLAFIGGWFYLKQHKKQVITFIETEAKKSLNHGTLHIGDISIGFRHTFPRIAFTIDTLTLRDGLWSRHHHDLISATRVYATLDFFKLILGKINIGRVELENPNIYLYTDSLGYSNTSMFQKNNPKKKSTSKNLDYPILQINQGLFSMNIENAHKFFGFDIHKLECHILANAENPGLVIDADLNCRVLQMTFSTEKGPFLEKKTVAGHFQIQFNQDSKILQFTKIDLAVDEQPFVFTGKFFLADVPTPFLLSWETDNLPFRKAASFLSPNIRLKLADYDISEPITHLTGSMDNSEPEYKTPLIHLRLKVDNKTITTPVVSIPHASFMATFNNEEIKGRGHEDSNTVMHFSSLKGNLDQMSFSCDTVTIRNLVHPRMHLHIRSDFQLENINNYLDEKELAFKRGKGNLNLVYNGSLEKKYDSLRMITGSLNMDSAELNYVPRNLLFTRGKGVIRFTGKDLIVDNLNLYSGSTDLIMKGALKSMFYLVNQKNKKLAIDWTIRSNKLNVNDFIAYLKQKQISTAPQKKKSSLAETLTEFTDLLETADFNLKLNAKQLIYKKFNGNNLLASLVMNDNFIDLKDIRIQCAGGSIGLQGSVRNESNSNPFSFNAQLAGVDVSQIFYAFDNFGLKSPTDKNIGGALTADVTMQGGLTTRAQIIPEELKGFVKFNLENGKLVNFEPAQKIQETVFKKRNFSDIQFADLHDLLEINGRNITVNRMEIRSTVLHMFVEGQYNTKTGPDLSIQVPLSNLKNNKDAELSNQGINSKTGVSARLRAQRGEDGKVKISWDPFNKAGKQLKAQGQKTKV